MALFMVTRRYMVGRVAQSVQRLATGWTVRGSNPGGARFSAAVQIGPGAHPASFTMGTWSFPEAKSGRGVTLSPHPFQCCGHERVELYLYSPYGSYGLYRASVPVQGCTLPLPYPYMHVGTERNHKESVRIGDLPPLTFKIRGVDSEILAYLLYNM